MKLQKSLKSAFQARNFSAVENLLKNVFHHVKQGSVTQVKFKHNLNLCKFKQQKISLFEMNKIYKEVQMRYKNEIDALDLRQSYMNLQDLLSLLYDYSIVLYNFSFIQTYFQENTAMDKSDVEMEFYKVENIVLCEVYFMIELVIKKIHLQNVTKYIRPKNNSQKKMKQFDLTSNENYKTEMIFEDEDEDDSEDEDQGENHLELPKKRRKISDFKTARILPIFIDFSNALQSSSCIDSKNIENNIISTNDLMYFGIDETILYFKVVMSLLHCILQCTVYVNGNVVILKQLDSFVLDLGNFCRGKFDKITNSRFVINKNKGKDMFDDFHKAMWKKIERIRNKLRLFIGRDQYIKGNYDISLKRLSLIKDKSYIDHHELMGILYYKKNDFVNSLKCFLNVPKVDTNIVGALYFFLRDFSNSIEWFKRSISENQNVNDHVCLNKRLIGLYNISLVQGKVGNYIVQFQMLCDVWKIIQICSKDSENDIKNVIDFKTFPNTIQIMYDLTICAIKIMNYEFAKESYEYLLGTLLRHENSNICFGTLSTSIIDIYNGYIFTLLELYQYENALNVIKKIEFTFKENIHLLLTKCDSLMSINQFDQANIIIDSLLQNISSYSKDVMIDIYIYKTLILSALQNDNCEDIIMKYYQRALEVDMNNSTLIYNMCLFLIQNHFITEGIARWFQHRSIMIDKDVNYYKSLLYQKKKDISSNTFKCDLKSKFISNLCEINRVAMDIECIHLYVLKIDKNKVKNNVEIEKVDELIRQLNTK